MPEVSFYILPTQTEQERLHFACKLAEKAYRNGQFCYILTGDQQQCKTVDDLLWTFRPGSFVPHQIYIGSATSVVEKVLIGTLPAPQNWQKVVINLSADCPDQFKGYERILEILDSDETIKAKGRKRYKRYQQEGLPITTHKL
ncbi:MAG: DNA polymerase III subunit chi [Gammaproteobacteria bacterium]